MGQYRFMFGFQELLSKYIEQDAKQGPSSQFADRAGCGLQAFYSSIELRGLSVRPPTAIPPTKYVTKYGLSAYGLSTACLS